MDGATLNIKCRYVAVGSYDSNTAMQSSSRILAMIW